MSKQKPDNEPTFAQQLADVRSMQAKREEQKRTAAALPCVPVDEETQQQAYDAEKLFEESARLSAEEQAAIEEKRAKTYRYFVRCRRNHKRMPPHGVYLKKAPEAGMVAATDWYSRYKKEGDQWMQSIVCQACLAERGEHVELNVTREGNYGAFRVNMRDLWKVAIDPKRRAIEGEIRAELLGPESSNFEVRAAQERLREAGMEVL